ncbi:MULTISPECIES: hypothetical protein [unclassified Microcoleus]|uniref:hypothetical protein n=1 Tax=unclassified Microcoleus TaxID=2642155 RepID=UPI002FD789A1
MADTKLASILAMISPAALGTPITNNVRGVDETIGITARFSVKERDKGEASWPTALYY